EEPVADFEAMGKAIQAAAARDPNVRLQVDRAGSERQLVVLAEADGSKNADGTPHFVLGIKPVDSRDALLRYGPIDAVPAAFAETWRMTATTFKLLGHLV